MDESEKPIPGHDVNLNLVSRLKNSENVKDILRDASAQELEEVAQIVRDRILEVVSKNGGHLSSTLGAVELIVGMHHVFDCQKNPFIFDVSHQSYAHKILTGRYAEFDTLRQLNGISGFIAPYESELDYFIAGHSSTSISLALGSAKARRLRGDCNKPIVMVGDGAMSAGLVYEGINELGELKLPVVIILNDNEMSIAKPIGSISRALSMTTASPFYQKIKKHTKRVLELLPESALYIAKRFEESLKLITPGLLFEELGLDYIGPIDGNNIQSIVAALKVAKQMETPVIIHAQTVKGKGYKVAEGKYEKWHGVGPFDISTGKPLNKTQSAPSPTQTFSKKLLELARKDSCIVGLTAAMPSGTGLDKLIDEFSDRFYDVGIAEQHAVTSASAMAREGLKPFVAVYSTFLQRAFDQIIHDCAIMKMPIRFCIDRAGIVGEDGETHQGLLDIGYLKGIPNLVVSAPRDNRTLEIVIEFCAGEITSPHAFRYPRNSFILDTIQDRQQQYDEDEYRQCLSGYKSQLLERNGSQILFIGYGNGVGGALQTMEAMGDRVDLLDLIYVKPLDSEMLEHCFNQYKFIFVFSDSYKINGVGDSIASLASELHAHDRIKSLPKIVSLEIEDMFIRHGNSQKVKEMIGMDANSLSRRVADVLSKGAGADARI